MAEAWRRLVGHFDAIYFFGKGMVGGTLGVMYFFLAVDLRKKPQLEIERLELEIKRLNRDR